VPVSGAGNVFSAKNLSESQKRAIIANIAENRSRLEEYERKERISKVCRIVSSFPSLSVEEASLTLERCSYDEARAIALIADENKAFVQHLRRFIAVQHRITGPEDALAAAAGEGGAASNAENTEPAAENNGEAVVVRNKPVVPSDPAKAAALEAARQASKEGKSVTLKTLLGAGKIKAGDQMKCLEDVGVLQPDGSIVFEGQRYRSVSSFAHSSFQRAKKLGNQNGWLFVHCNGVLTKAIRDEFIASANQHGEKYVVKVRSERVNGTKTRGKAGPAAPKEKKKKLKTKSSGERAAAVKEAKAILEALLQADEVPQPAYLSDNDDDDGGRRRRAPQTGGSRRGRKSAKTANGEPSVSALFGNNDQDDEEGGNHNNDEDGNEDNEEDHHGDDTNPLPGFLDPITLDEVVRPALSPYGHVMSYLSWSRWLTGTGKNICPLTKKPLSKRDLIILTMENIEEHRHKIVKN
jgi:hypothetical protein